LPVEVFLQDVDFFLWELFPLIDGPASQGNADGYGFRFELLSEDIDVAPFVTSDAYHQTDQLVKLNHRVALAALKVEMEGGVTFDEIPEMPVFLALFERGLVVKAEATGYFAAMKALLHHDQTAGDIDHLPRM